MHVSVLLAVLLLIALAVTGLFSLALKGLGEWRYRQDLAAGRVVRREAPSSATFVSSRTTENLWQARRECAESEAALTRAILSACDLEPDAVSLPIGEVGFEASDRSFSLRAVLPGWRPDAAALARCWALGFDRCHLVYLDGTEFEGSRMHGLRPVRVAQVPQNS
jgi:hypothetical protein